MKIGNKLEDSMTKKIVIANMTSRIEAFLDYGEYLSSKSTIIFFEKDIPLELFLGILNSKLATFYYKYKYNSSKMSGGALSVTKSRISSFPIHEDYDGLYEEIIKSVKEYLITLDDYKLEEVDKYVCMLYGLDNSQIKIINEI